MLYTIPITRLYSTAQPVPIDSKPTNYGYSEKCDILFGRMPLYSMWLGVLQPGLVWTKFFFCLHIFV